MKESATTFLLGQWLLLTPLASKLNKKNLEGLDQLLQKQAMFCKEISFTVNNDVKDVDHQFTLQIKGKDTQWTLQKVLMQLAHLDQEECSFFHAIDHNRNGNGITVAMLPNTVQHRSTAVRHLLPFTKWILEPTLGPIQAHKVETAFTAKTITRQIETAFTAKTITRQMAWQWDPTNNCMLQVDSTLMGRALHDFPLYNLTTTTHLPTMVTTTAMPKDTPVAQAPLQSHVVAHATNDSDSLSNSTLSQGMWFMMTTTQIDAIAMQQNKLEAQTSSQLTTILVQLETIHALMEEQRNWNKHYNEYDGYDRDWPFTPEHSNMESEQYDYNNDMLGSQAAGDSHMEDASTLK